MTRYVVVVMKAVCFLRHGLVEPIARAGAALLASWVVKEIVACREVDQSSAYGQRMAQPPLSFGGATADFSAILVLDYS